MLCTKDHSNIRSILEEITKDQGGQVRHICAGCAYDQGYKHGQQNISPNFNVDIIPDSQADRAKQRHRSPNIAYARGYVDGYNSRTRRK